MASTFFDDGYRHAWGCYEPSPPDISIYRAEYLAGYQKCLDDMKATERHQ